MHKPSPDVIDEVSGTLIHAIGGGCILLLLVHVTDFFRPFHLDSLTSSVVLSPYSLDELQSMLNLTREIDSKFKE